MFCKKCGREIPDASKFCPYCGEDLTGINNTNEVNHTETINLVYPTYNFDTAETTRSDLTQITPLIQPEKKKNILPVILLVGFLFIAGIAAAAYFFFFNAKRLNPEDFVYINTTGVNGFGYSEVYVDYEKLNNLIGEDKMKKAIKKIVKDNNIDFEGYYGMTVDEYLETDLGKTLLQSYNFYDYQINNDTNLSNGDEVEVLFIPGTIASDESESMSLDQINRLLGVKLNETYKKKVEGLGEGTLISIVIPDVEQYIMFAGSEGKGTATFKLSGNSYSFADGYTVNFTNDNYGEVSKNGAYVGSLSYSLSPDNPNVKPDQLKEGDILSVVVTPDSALVNQLANDQYSASKDSPKVTVKKLGQSVDPLQFDLNQLYPITQDVVIDARNNHLTDETASLIGCYKITDKTTNSYGLAYLFKTTKNNHFFKVVSDVTLNPDNSLSYGKVEEINTSSSNPLDALSSKYDCSSMNVDVIHEKYTIGKQAIVTNKGVRVRSGPGTDYSHVTLNGSKANYEEGEVIEIVDESTDSDNDIWYKVNFQRNNQTYTYWISGMYTMILP